MEDGQEVRSLEDIYREERGREGPVVIPPQIDPEYSAFLESHRKIEGLGTLLAELQRYKELAWKNPGTIVDGNPILGAPFQYYSPTEEEKRVSEIGKTVEAIVSGCKDLESCLRLVRYTVDNNIYEDVVTYEFYHFCYVDVVGSGRFIYPEGPFQRSFSIITTMLECLVNTTEAAFPGEELQGLRNVRGEDKQDIKNCLQGILRLCSK